MNIYPKTCKNFIGLDKMMSFVEKYKGVELQFFDENNQIMSAFEFESVIYKLMEKIPYLKEITIHPPLCYYDIENIMFKDINIIKEQFEVMVKLSRKYNIKINMVYHTTIDFKTHKELTLDKLSKLLKILEGENVTLLLENIFMFSEEECTVYQIADYLKHPNLKVCFDICHMYCRANINKQDIYEYAKGYLNPELCKKYTYQVHFSYTADNDGYVNFKATHGLVHPSIEELRYDVELLKKYNMDNCNYITEISEKDYESRKDQYKELKMLEEVSE